jgi:DNA-binding IclR family transcriptional regulator
LRACAQEAAQRGYAVSSSEWDEGLTAVAVPVTGRSGSVVASLSLSGPSHRFPYEAVERFATDLAESAALISARGFSHPLSQGR